MTINHHLDYISLTSGLNDFSYYNRFKLNWLSLGLDSFVFHQKHLLKLVDKSSYQYQEKLSNKDFRLNLRYHRGLNK